MRRTEYDHSGRHDPLDVVERRDALPVSRRLSCGGPICSPARPDSPAFFLIASLFASRINPVRFGAATSLARCYRFTLISMFSRSPIQFRLPHPGLCRGKWRGRIRCPSPLCSAFIDPFRDVVTHLSAAGVLHSDTANTKTAPGAGACGRCPSPDGIPREHVDTDRRIRRALRVLCIPALCVGGWLLGDSGKVAGHA